MTAPRLQADAPAGEDVRSELAEKLGIPAGHLRRLPIASVEVALARVSKLETEVATAQIDQLTGLPLRGPGAEAVHREISRAGRADGRPLLVLAYLDVNDLKKTNDSGGHDAGDLLIRSVAAALRDRVRPYDVAIRWGGDEFVCVLPGLAAGPAKRLFEEVNEDVGRRCGGSVSVGLAHYRSGDTPDAMLQRADAQLYRAKQARHVGRDLA